MFVARLICSDRDCAEAALLEAPTLAELERLVCDCGCALEVIAWPDRVDEADGRVVTLVSRHEPGRGELRSAA